MAVASFVLSLVWIAGLGSLLAVIFSVQARRQIRRSQGTQGGEGLAVAGLVIGILGILGAALFFALAVAVGSGVHHIQTALSPRTATMKVGQTATLSTDLGSYNSGIATVAVTALSYPVTPATPALLPDTGKQLAVADIQVCAGQDGSQTGPSNLLFRVRLAGGTEIDPSFIDAETPSLNDVRGLGANQCARGYLTFQLPSASTPVAVTYQPGPFRTYEWTLP